MNLAFFTGIIVLMVVYFFANPTGVPELQSFVGYVLVTVGVPLMLLIAVILQGLRNTPAVPPTRSIRTWFGKPDLGGYPLGPGYHFYLFRGWLGSYIDVEVDEEDFNIVVTGKTPDLQSVQVVFTMTVAPDFTTNEDLYELIKSNDGLAGSVYQIREMVRERGREWLESGDEGPQTWQEARGQQEELVALILKKLSDDLEPTDLPHPTGVLMKYFSKRMPLPSEAKKWGDKWEVLETWFAGLSVGEKAEVRGKIDRRRKLVNDARNGRGNIKKRGLGLEIRRINCGDIGPLGKTAEIADRIAIEAIERVAESVDLEHSSDWIKKFQKDFGISFETAKEMVEIALKRIHKDVTEHKFSVTTETGKLIGDIVGRLAERFLAEKAAPKKEGDS